MRNFTIKKRRKMKEDERGVFTKGGETPLAMQFQRSGQVVCLIKGYRRMAVYMYKGVGRLLWQCNSRGVSS
jgi:hypothetical protein